MAKAKATKAKAAAKSAKKPVKAAKKPAKAAKKPAKAAKKPKPAKATKPAKAAKPAKATKPAVSEKPAVPAPTVSDDTDPELAPAKFQVRTNGTFEIWFDIGAFDGDLDVQDAFAKFDLTGNGYEWEAVLAPALKRAHPAAFAAIEWDNSEADTFVVASKERSALVMLASVLRDVVKTQTSLEAAIARHDPDRT